MSKRMNMEAIKYITYGRVSAQEQRKNTSVEAQLRLNQEGMTTRFPKSVCVKEFTDVATATSSKRPGLTQALSYVKWHNQVAKVPIDYIIVLEWDRFFRNRDLSGEYRGKFKACGVEVNAINEWTDYNDGGAVVMLSVREGLAQSESMKNSSRTKRGMRERMRKGYWIFSAPLGYKKTDELHPNGVKKVLIDEGVAQQKNRCLSFIAGGMNAKAAWKMCGGFEVLKSYNNFMEKIINPFDLGIIDHTYPDGERIQVEGMHPAIATKELQLAAHRAMIRYKKAKAKAGDRDVRLTKSLAVFPARQVLRCPNCGRGLTSCTPRMRNGDRAAYYSCPNNQCRPQYNLRKDTAHADLHELFMGVNLSASAIAQLDQVAKFNIDEAERVLKTETKTLIAKLATQHTRVANLVNMLADGNATPEDVKLARSQVGPLQDRLNENKAVVDAYLSSRGKMMEAFRNIGPSLAKGLKEGAKQELSLKLNHFLKVLFPDGLWHLPETGAFGTTEINKAFVRTDLFSVSYTILKTGFQPPKTENPVRGGKACANGTIRSLTSDASLLAEYLKKYSVA